MALAKYHWASDNLTPDLKAEKNTGPTFSTLNDDEWSCVIKEYPLLSGQGKSVDYPYCDLTRLVQIDCGGEVEARRRLKQREHATFLASHLDAFLGMQSLDLADIVAAYAAAPVAKVSYAVDGRVCFESTIWSFPYVGIPRDLIPGAHMAYSNLSVLVTGADDADEFTLTTHAIFLPREDILGFRQADLGVLKFGGRDMFARGGRLLAVHGDGALDTRHVDESGSRLALTPWDGAPVPPQPPCVMDPNPREGRHLDPVISK